MSYRLSKVEVWAADIVNRPGMLARVLEALTNAGASLEFMVARRASENTSRLFLAPLKGAKQKQAATNAGLVPAAGMHTVCICGPDRPGLGAEITRAVADQGVNLRGASAASIGGKATIYLGLASASDLEQAIKVVKRALTSRASKRPSSGPAKKSARKAVAKKKAGKSRPAAKNRGKKRSAR